MVEVAEVVGHYHLEVVGLGKALLLLVAVAVPGWTTRPLTSRQPAAAAVVVVEVGVQALQLQNSTHRPTRPLLLAHHQVATGVQVLTSPTPLHPQRHPGLAQAVQIMAVVAAALAAAVD